MNVQLPDGSIRKIQRDPCTIEEILNGLNINPLEVIVSVNGRVAPEDTVVGNDDTLRIIRIAHGG
jgi:sulfur carrier protein